MAVAVTKRHTAEFSIEPTAIKAKPKPDQKSTGKAAKSLELQEVVLTAAEEQELKQFDFNHRFGP